MTRYMLDTNTVSDFLRRHRAVTARVVAIPMAALCISAVTAGELLFGVAKRPEATQLHRAVQEFLRRTDALPWDMTIAVRYSGIRADMARLGRALAPLDMLIAAHALAAGAVLVTSDRAFGQVPGLQVDDWTG